MRLTEIFYKVRSGRDGSRRETQAGVRCHELCFSRGSLTQPWESCRRQSLKSVILLELPVVVLAALNMQDGLVSELRVLNKPRCVWLCCPLCSALLSLSLLFSPRSVSGLDKEADLVHMEVRTADGCEC